MDQINDYTRLIVFPHVSNILGIINDVQDIVKQVKDKYPNIIKQIRGKGLLIGIQLHKDQTLFIKKLMENKLLTIKAAENVIRILPPLNVKKSEIDVALKVIGKVCSES